MISPTNFCVQLARISVRGTAKPTTLPGADFISPARFEAFKGADHFYNIAFHELTHWTGHKSRLDRDLKHRFGEQRLCGRRTCSRVGGRVPRCGIWF